MRIAFFIFTLSLLPSIYFSASCQSDSAKIIDSRHYSHVFGEIRNFRVFLPPGYSVTGQKRYPVIYFFHGWSQRYFGDGGEEYAGFDKGNQNNGDNIANYVSKNDVIVVKADGYNRRQDEPYYKRPYNVLPVETYRQFPIYFPELVDYIDQHYKTLPDRQHRGISGLSMGGFMTFMIAAKYPHMVSAAGSFCGAPEFTIGPYDFPVEYRHIDMYRNFDGVNLRLHYGDKDFIRSYHQDMNRAWSPVMDNYRWKIYDAEHSTCGLGEMFDSIQSTFRNPLPRPSRWDHAEVYPEFTVWDYNVSTDRAVPGFTVLENVDKRGFRCAVRELVPDGQLIQNVNVLVTTAPIYDKNRDYFINDYDVNSKKASQIIIKSDEHGRLAIPLNGSIHEIGINIKNDKPELTVLPIIFKDGDLAQHGKEVKIAVKLLNKGMTAAKNVKATIAPFRKNAKVTSAENTFGNIEVNQTKEGNGIFSFVTSADSIELIRINIDITADNNSRWSHFLDVPLKKKVKDFTEIEIADGRTVSVVASGIDIETLTLGTGNGDGIANPGESVVVLVKDSGKLWRTDLTFSDPYLNPRGIVTRRSDWWTNMDHVGASAKYDEVLISSQCPDNYSANLFAEYWTPDYPMHIVHEGNLKLNIGGTDKTPPSVKHINVKGDNTIEVKIIDGGNIKNASAKFIMQYEFDKTFTVELNDAGKNGDMVSNDNVFSFTIPDKKFGIYRVIVEATDENGNKGAKEASALFVVH